MIPRFTCDEKTVWCSIKKSQNVTAIIVEIKCAVVFSPSFFIFGKNAMEIF